MLPLPENLSDATKRAKQLAPLSVRLRAFLEVLARNPDKPLTPSHPIHQLPKLVAEVESAQPPPELPLPANYGTALRSLTNRAFCEGTKYREQQGRARRAGAHSDILEFERRFVRRFLKLGVPVFCHSMVRTDAEQAAIYVRGASNAQPGQSPHGYGFALDLVHGIHAWDLRRAHWDLLGHVGKEIALQMGVELTWGGDWRFYDPAHWELKDWKSRVDPGSPRPQG